MFFIYLLEFEFFAVASWMFYFISLTEGVIESYPGLKNSTRFHYDGFDYRQDNLHLIRVKQFRCSKKGCPGRARHPVDQPQQVKVMQSHHHAKNSRPFKVWKLRAAVDDAAVKDLSTPLHDIFNRICRE